MSGYFIHWNGMNGMLCLAQHNIRNSKGTLCNINFVKDRTEHLALMYYQNDLDNLKLRIKTPFQFLKLRELATKFCKNHRNFTSFRTLLHINLLDILHKIVWDDEFIYRLSKKFSSISNISFCALRFYAWLQLKILTVCYSFIGPMLLCFKLS